MQGFLPFPTPHPPILEQGIVPTEIIELPSNKNITDLNKGCTEIARHNARIRTQEAAEEQRFIYELQVNPVANEKLLHNMEGRRDEDRKGTKAATYFYDVKEIKAKGKMQAS